MNQPLDHINNLEQLQLAIKTTKQRIKQREADFEERWQRIPQETVKATIGNVFPFFRNATVASGTWTVIKTIAGLLNKTENPLLAAAKKVGISALVDWAFGLLGNKEEKTKHQ